VYVVEFVVEVAKMVCRYCGKFAVTINPEATFPEIPLPRIFSQRDNTFNEMV
jgi:hypothetical protein